MELSTLKCVLWSHLTSALNLTLKFKSLNPTDFQIKTHDTMESVYRDIPMSCLPVEYLPDDYTGPNVGPIDDIIRMYSLLRLLYEIRKSSVLSVYGT